MSSNNALRKAKHKAYEKKEEEKGKNVVNWIFGILVFLAVLTCVVLINYKDVIDKMYEC